MVNFKHIPLQEVIQDVFVKNGAVPEAAMHVAAAMVQTSLRGVDSHGINLFPHYHRALGAGRIHKAPKIAVIRQSASAAVVDADHAFGHHAGAVAIDLAIAMAKKTGIAAVSVKNSSHFGAAAYFSLRAAQENCLGFSFTNADALVQSYGSPEVFLGTNPICFTAPLKNEGPLCLDMATSIVSWNKIKDHRRHGESIPDDWACAKDGSAVTDPHLAACLRPMGGYKGYGLGIMVDILCGVLTNSLVSKDILPMYRSPLEKPRHISHFFMALDIRHFCDVEAFKAQLQDTVDRLRKQSPLVGGQEVMAPGDPEKKSYQRRIVEGIPVDKEVYEDYLAISKDFSRVTL